MKSDQRMTPDIRLDFIFLLSACPLVKQIVANPGIVAVTGPPGSGKSFSIFALASEAAHTRPVSVIWPKDSIRLDQDWKFPPNWKVHYLPPEHDAVKKFWHSFPYQKEQVIVTDMPVFDLWQNEDPRPIPKDARVLCLFDTPLLGLDVAYYLRFLGEKQILDNFTGFISQNLTPRLCKACKKQLPDPDAIEAGPVWQEVGCEECKNTGCRGQQSLHELLLINDEVRFLIHDFLEQGALGVPPAECHVSMPAYAKELLDEGRIGLRTYKRLMVQNPLLRGRK